MYSSDDSDFLDCLSWLLCTIFFNSLYSFHSSDSSGFLHFLDSWIPWILLHFIICTSIPSYSDFFLIYRFLIFLGFHDSFYSLDFLESLTVFEFFIFFGTYIFVDTLGSLESSNSLSCNSSAFLDLFYFSDFIRSLRLILIIPCIF